MPLHVGTRLGPYEILAAIGAGGMGEVYKARDTRLDRTVAIKILPETLAADPQFRDRFEREARTISQLDHPNICALYDVGEQEGTSFLVMQYLEGETLEARLRKGALPMGQALKTGIEIASALDKAHHAGVVHRDLKPGNIMLTKGGAKLLDFGLAKAESWLTNPQLSMLSTAAPAALTAQGTILGTFQYMAPEQLEGHEADPRTDIFAFGAVLYEALSGEKAFSGTSQASLIASILERQPTPLRALQPIAPASLDHVIARCLAKSRDDRWQTTADLMRELRWISEMPASVERSASSGRTRVGAPVTWAVAAALALALGLVAGYELRPAAKAKLWRTDILTPRSGDASSLALSPDGRQIAFVANTETAPKLWVRQLDQTSAQPLTGTDGATAPFWSPDGRSLGFFAQGRLQRIDLPSGTPQVLAFPPSSRGGAWSKSGIILFAPGTGSGLLQVPATGGTTKAATQLAADQLSHRWPQFLPDGRFLYLVLSSKPEIAGTYVGSLDGAPPVRVLEAAAFATRYAPPHWLLVVRQSILFALPFDLNRLAVSGDPLPVAQGFVGPPVVPATIGNVAAPYSASDTGVLAYRAGGVVQVRQLTWVDRAGRTLGTVGLAADDAVPANPQISPDGHYVAFNRIVQGNNDVWIVDARNVMTRFTFEPYTQGAPLWSPDGSRMVFGASPKGTMNLYEKPSTGAGEDRLVLDGPQSSPLDWSRDGRFLLYSVANPKMGVDLQVVPMTGSDRTPIVIIQTPFDELNGQFSPDGHWIAYQSNEGGRHDVYVRPFPGKGGQWQLSTSGGTQPRWRADGKEIFYVAPDGKMMAVPLTVAASGQSLEIGTPTALFATHLATGTNIPAGPTSKPQYAVAADGRFLLNTVVEDALPPPINIAINWDPALEPTKK